MVLLFGCSIGNTMVCLYYWKYKDPVINVLKYNDPVMYCREYNGVVI